GGPRRRADRRDRRDSSSLIPWRRDGFAARRHPGSALDRAVHADPASLRARRRSRREGLHARVSGRDAYRRAQPDAASGSRRNPLRPELRRALSRPEVAALLAALALAGCGSSAEQRHVAIPAAGPPGVVRVALTDFRWPLDPALARG